MDPPESNPTNSDDQIPPTLASLPRELLLRLALFLSLPNLKKPVSILRLSATCKDLHFLAADSVLWKSIYDAVYSKPGTLATQSNVEWAKLHRVRTEMLGTAINILVPFNHGTQETSFDTVSLGEMHAVFSRPKVDYASRGCRYQRASGEFGTDFRGELSSEATRAVSEPRVHAHYI